ncbi:Aste57867_1293 [Aphanomyces stellatus]|uniref:Aste57867_1293 protein n=1 Tax=Aphanomyces stellatus TaxID=120398 RepID=A0A485K9Y5_9STRA|nr:hypothetical protein As57867_001292 [Aphanomyces stellatus]VFT78512.1 Aste57867_1293 [Aphanomyces stellatus]
MGGWATRVSWAKVVTQSIKLPSLIKCEHSSLEFRQTPDAIELDQDTMTHVFHATAAADGDLPPLPNRVFCTFRDCGKCGQFFKDSYTRSCGMSSSSSSSLVLGVTAGRCRCFPHCCPDHVPHSSCGTSVVMQVAGQYSAVETSTFVAFGRFETCLEPSLPLGHLLSLDDVLTPPPGLSPTAVWFASSGQTLHQNPLLYSFKDKQSDPWHYGWTSGASAALRSTQHAFKAYLFQYVPGTRSIQVVGIAQSPGFTIIPYKPMGHEEVESPVPAAAIEADVAPQTAFECNFIPCQCEKPMFGDNYIRCNRANGRKQLRCFPHCCPEHILHCSCGGPIMIGVDLSQAPPLARPAKELVMYAHGERHHMPELHLNEEIPHDMILSRLHQPGNERGDWVKGIVQPYISSATTLLFNFNQNSKQAGWPYNWKGSATKVDRNRKHIFKAYVFQVSRGGDTLRVVNWISSTPFTMSSFRRCNTTPTSRTNSYIEVKPTEIIDRNELMKRAAAPPLPMSRKRSHERVSSPPPILNDMNNSAG